MRHTHPLTWTLAKITAALLLLLTAQALPAQSYKKLWEEAQAASDKDLPRTALEWVGKISEKASAEGNDAQMLRAALMTFQYGGELSPDTAAARLKEMEAALARETRPAVRALWHSALAQTYLSRRTSLRADTADASAARRHFEASLAEPRTLAKAQWKDYLPLFSAGADSRHYGDDLLHVLYAAYRDKLHPSKDDQLRRLNEYAYIYKESGRTEAALLTECEAATLQGGGKAKSLSERTDYRLLTDIAQRYESLPLNVETYIRLTQLDGRDSAAGNESEAADSTLVALAQKGVALYGKEARANVLRNFVTVKQQPQASLSCPDGAQPYPGTRHALSLRSRNIKLLEVRVFKLWDSETEEANNGEEWEAMAKKRRSKTAALSVRPAPLAAYLWQKTDTAFSAPAVPGVYALELWGDGKPLDHRTLKVTALQPLVFSGTRRGRRVAVVDRQSGTPVPDVKITRYKADSEGKWRQDTVYVTNAGGMAYLPYTQAGGRAYASYRYTVSTDSDKAAPAFALYGQPYTAGASQSPAYTSVRLFTDRAIYRPSQRVAFSGVVFTRNGDDYKTQAGYEATVYLRNANNKAVDSLAIRSDDFGAFGGELQIPSSGLTGGYTLQAANKSNRAYARITVEEYKRPTFTASTLPVRAAYALGDTLRVTGEARTFSGVAVSGAKVSWTSSRAALLYRRAYSDETEETAVQRGECATDDEGRFVLPVPLTASADEIGGKERNLFLYTVAYTVTAENGETAQGSLTLRAANRRAWIEHNVPSRVCLEERPALQARVVNAAGESVADGGTFKLLRGTETVEAGTFEAGKAIQMPHWATLASGRYALALAAPGAAEPDTARFLLFSQCDIEPADKEEPFFFYSHLNATADTAYVQTGTPEKDVTVFFDLVAGDSIVNSMRFPLSDKLVGYHLAYRPEFGDGATAHFCFFRNDKFYHNEVSVRRPAPDKRMSLTWSTFRSRLTPGQKEEWRLRVTHPDGTPARASLTARLYDASLDALGAGGAAWSFGGISFSRSLPSAFWRAPLPDRAVSLGGSLPVKYRKSGGLTFAQWQDALFDYGYGTGDYMLFSVTGGTNGRMRSRVRPTSMFSAAANKAAIAGKVGSAQLDGASGDSATETAVEKQGTADTAATSVTPRTDFNETAYFSPALRTDTDGVAIISFTLPESVTSWRFNALAHTIGMEYGLADTTATASKDFMAVPAVPRFLRQGDRTEIPVTLQNLTARTVNAVVELSLTDALTGKSVYSSRQKVGVEGGKSLVANFPYSANTEPGVLICRAVATGSGHSDGEEHYLPVLSSLTEVTRTLPFSLDKAGSTSLRLDTLFSAKGAAHRSLTVEVTSNPLWYAVSCLPALATTEGDCLSATDWAERLYALCIGNKIGRDNPAIRQTLEASPGETDELARLKTEGLTDETPWLRHAESEAARTAALRSLFDEETAANNKHTALDHLLALQGADGAWSWHKGMPANDFITADVAILLARTECLTGDKTAHSAFARAFAYLKSAMAKEVKGMKEAEKNGKGKIAPSETQLRYLYLHTLIGEKPDADANFLIERAKLLTKSLTMYGKALTAVVLAQSGEKEEADLRLKSMLEHTVSNGELGRWFDTPRAEWAWKSYRIPTQCAAIEALRLLGGDSTARKEMQLWLLQAKRTQMWETSRATADAVYCLLSPDAAESNTLRLAAGAAPVYYTLYDKKKQISAVNAKSESATAATAGYFKRQYAVDDTGAGLPRIGLPSELRLRKSDNGLSWGCVYATYTLPAAEVADEGKGLTLTRRMEKLQADGSWTLLAESDAPACGTRVRTVYTVTADRDYNFVEIESARPACLSPVRALSGYGWSDGLAAYRAVRDSRTQYFVEKMRKGSHTFTEEFFVDRAGLYESGTATVRCVYAPEFAGTAKSFRIAGK